RLALQAFELRPRFGKFEPQGADMIAQLARACAQFLIGLECVARNPRLVERAARFVEVAGQPLLCFVECREPRELRRGGALRRRQRLADAMVRGLRLALRAACRLLAPTRLFGCDAGSLEGGAGLRCLLARRRKPGFEIGEPVALFETARGCGRRIGGGRVAVPAPQRTLARDEALAGLQFRLKPLAVRGLDDADLRQAA